MTVVSKTQTPSSKPTDLSVVAHGDKSLEIRWAGTDGECNECYELEIRYFRLGGVMIQPDHSAVFEVKGWAVHLPHPEKLSKASAWVVKIALRAKSDGLPSEKITQQVSWDDELSAEAMQDDLKKRTGELKSEIESFKAIRGRGKPSFLLLGGQHHGKSSFLNHMFRCLKCDSSEDDHVDVASAGTEEKTVETQSLDVPVNGTDVAFIDTPAFANMNAETAGKLKTLLSSGIVDGKRRDKLSPDELSWFSKPPHGAIVVMSLVHWRDQPDEMQKYLEKMADVFKNASGCKVAFPYVVACTHRDVFLKDCQKEDPAKELQKAVEEIRKAALTKHVYPITNYEKDCVGSARNNKATFDLLSQLLTKAKHENTAKVQEWNRTGMYLMVLMVVMFLMVVRASR